MTLHIDLREHFGAPVLSLELPAFIKHRQALLDLIWQLKADSQGVKRSNQIGSWHSYEDLNRNSLPAIQWLCSRIVELSGRGIASARGQKEPVAVRVGSMWANINEAHGWNAPHHHLPADWSGVFWVDAEEEKEAPKDVIPPGALLFIDPLPLPSRYGRNGSSYYLPKDGCLLIFPAYLVHMVAPHSRNNPRVSMSFNLKFINEDPDTKVSKNIQ